MPTLTTLELTDSGAIAAIVSIDRKSGARRELIPIAEPIWRLGEKLAESSVPEHASGRSAGESRVLVETDAARAEIVIRQREATTIVHATLDTDQREGAPERFGLVIVFPDDAIFHLPDSRSGGRLLDRSMPAGEQFACSCAYNFLLVQTKIGLLRLLANDVLMNALQAELRRHPSAFALSVSLPVGTELQIELFDSIGAATDSYRNYLRESHGVIPHAERRIDQWPLEVRFALTIDMLRSHGEIAHDYHNVTRLVGELAETGAPRESLLYLPGWNADYDAGYPDYAPAESLGGVPAFREMLAAIHSAGFRVMLHMNSQGVDPSNPRAVELETLCVGDPANGGNWQMPPEQMPPNVELAFRVPKTDVELASAGASRYVFDTVPILDACEAKLRIGGIPLGSNGARVTIGRRSLLVPAQTSAVDGGYRFTYAFALKPGINTVIVEPLGASVQEPSAGVQTSAGRAAGTTAWYAVDACYAPPEPYSPWTYPIRHADVGNPRWIAEFLDAAAALTERFDVDAIHLDAATHLKPTDQRALFSALRERLPSLPIGGEWCSSLLDVGFWSVCQGSRASLLHGTEHLRRAQDVHAPSARAGIARLFTWLDQPSPICEFVRDYMRSYPHLCAADAFVPVGKVCNTQPPRQRPLDPAELDEVLDNARRFGTIPTLRVNFREYGLDRGTRRAIARLFGASSSRRSALQPVTELPVAICQFAVAADPAANTATIVSQIAEAASAGARIAVFPECGLSGYLGAAYMPATVDWPATEKGQERIATAAAEHKIAVVYGTALRSGVPANDQSATSKDAPVTNAALVISPQGEVMCVYHKRFLTSGDAKHFAAGRDPIVFEIDGVRCGIVICYEKWFPELFRDYKRRGVDLVFDLVHSPERNLAEDVTDKELIPNEERSLWIAHARVNHIWLAVSNHSRPEQDNTSFLVDPDGRIQLLPFKKQAVRVFTTRIGEKLWDPSGGLREIALSGAMYLPEATSAHISRGA